MANTLLYLLYKNLLPSQRGRHATTSRKERRNNKSEKIEENPTSIPEIDALIGEEEQMEKRREKKKNRERISNPATLEPSVASYDPQESYNEPILVTPPGPQGDCWQIFTSNFPFLPISPSPLQNYYNHNPRANKSFKALTVHAIRHPMRVLSKTAFRSSVLHPHS